MGQVIGPIDQDSWNAMAMLLRATSYLKSEGGEKDEAARKYGDLYRHMRDPYIQQAA